MSDCVKVVYVLCNDFGYDGINIIGVYDDITLAKQAAIVDHVNRVDLIPSNTEYSIFACGVNRKMDDDCHVDFIVDADTIIAYGVKSV